MGLYAGNFFLQKIAYNSLYAWYYGINNDVKIWFYDFLRHSRKEIHAKLSSLRISFNHRSIDQWYASTYTKIICISYFLAETRTDAEDYIIENRLKVNRVNQPPSHLKRVRKARISLDTGTIKVLTCSHAIMINRFGPYDMSKNVLF